MRGPLFFVALTLYVGAMVLAWSGLREQRKPPERAPALAVLIPAFGVPFNATEIYSDGRHKP